MAKINEEVTKKQMDCEKDLEKAEPALQAAQDALNTLNKVPLIFQNFSIQSINNFYQSVK